MVQHPTKIQFEKSPLKNKKYRVFFNLGKEEYYVDFGQKGYEQYKDSTPLKLYSKYDHGDKYRRYKYLTRAEGIVNGQGKKTADDPRGANYWSIRYLW